MANLVSQLALKNRKLAEDYGRQFKNTFGIDLGSFMDWITGFDVIKFDVWLGTPDNKSTADFITEQYNENAAQLVRKLCG